MKLSELLQECDFENGDFADCQIHSISTDSRQVCEGSLFIAIKGLHVDGHDYIQKAVDAGCAALVVDSDRGWIAGDCPPIIKVSDSRVALGKIAASFYGYPSSNLIMTGVTGTNGKTTSTYLLEAIIRESGGVPGVIGTINYRFNEVERKAAFTTPEPVELNKILREMLDAGVTHVLMEVSSHALAQKRLQGILFDVALFGNLTRDHLDFHGSMEEYFCAKKELFCCHLKADAHSLIFVETEADEGGWGRRLVRELKKIAQCHVSTCSMATGADFYCQQVEHDVSGSQIIIKAAEREIKVETSLVGSFNVKNVIGAAAVAVILGVDDSAIIRGLASLQKVPGRMEKISTDCKGETLAFSVFVDYAHTPDAMENALSTLNELGPQRLIVVFGCGGDRDSGKRALMGEVAGRLADLVVITADNSRSEDTAVIINQIISGVESTGKNNINDLTNKKQTGYMVVPSRQEAIVTAIKAAAKGDIVLISGKGHETYQISREGTAFFDDRIEAANVMMAL